MADSRPRLSHARPVWVERLTRESCSRASPFAVHDYAVLCFLTDGHAVHEQRGRFDVRGGDVLLVPAGEKHRLLQTSGGAGWGVGFCVSCYAPSELANLLDPFERARSGASPVVCLPPQRHDYMARLSAELHDETRSERAHGEIAQKSLLALMLAEVSRAARTAPPVALQPSVVGDALRFIERNCLSPISLSDIARALGKSPSYVTTALKKATGKSAGEWIIAGRLTEARNRLLHTDEMVEIIAERVGYRDATHFIRLFRRTYGATPAAWRNEQRRRGPSSRADEPGRAPS